MILSIKRYRQFAGLTQKELSSLANMNLSSYQAKEQGRVSFSDDEKVTIKEIISNRINGPVSIDEIFFGSNVQK
ncbi:helix-turn-helix transcriptional regulator [Lapidilactobacillus bayanensis]|uniref:helix-turn-helix transcriptional regulator n=1 Tax=Lapidilactobacillus bayanensis TaxID=2485998 RepID=UPI000F7A2EC0|nr:XRE family transcriptional regulator [Lapidilactobacillus bayanensis]